MAYAWCCCTSLSCELLVEPKGRQVTNHFLTQSNIMEAMNNLCEINTFRANLLKDISKSMYIKHMHSISINSSKAQTIHCVAPLNLLFRW